MQNVISECTFLIRNPKLTSNSSQKYSLNQRKNIRFPKKEGLSTRTMTDRFSVILSAFI